MPGSLRFAALAAALLVPVGAERSSGEAVKCILDRAHAVTFDVSGKPNGDETTLADLENVSISVRPAPERDADCQKTRLDSQTPHCVGVNEDSTCQAAKEMSLPLMFGLGCTDCFGALALDTYYDLHISMFKLHSLGLGFKNLRLVANASLEKTLQKQLDKSGSWPLPGTGLKHTVLDVTVACPLCVHVHVYVMMQSSVDWSVTDTVTAAFRAGMAYEANFGNEMVKYDAGKGWSMESFHHPNVTMKPVLGAAGESVAIVKASMPSNVRLGVENIGWLQVGTTPNFTGNLTVEGSSTPDASVCLGAQGGIDAATEAAIDIRLAGFRPQYHWSPREFLSWKSNVTSMCKKLVGTTTKPPAMIQV